MNHDVVHDPSMTGHDRWTCHTCESTCLRAPWMSDIKWEHKRAEWLRVHTRGSQHGN